MRFLRRSRSGDPPPGSVKLLRCSFCNKSQRDVKKLIAGPKVYICDECVDICVDVIAEDRVIDGGTVVASEGEPRLVASPMNIRPGINCSFCGRPTAPIELPKGTVMCMPCVVARANRRDEPGGNPPAG